MKNTNIKNKNKKIVFNKVKKLLLKITSLFLGF